MEALQFRKRIWEVDCLSMDGALAAAFCWQEMANLLQATEHHLDFDLPESILEMQVQCVVHRHCHTENVVSVRLERLLNCLYKSEIERLSGMDPGTIIHEVMHQACSRKLGGMIWALGTDPRDGFECIRRRFHQRLQVMTIRRLMPAEKSA